MKSGYMKKRLLLTLLPFLLAGCPDGVDQSAQAPVNPAATVIGLLQPLASGSSIDRELAARLAVSEINAAGGVNGQPLDVRVVYDKDNNPSFGVPSARSLVDSGVVAIVGANSSAVTIPVAEEVTIPAHVALITPGGTSPRISTLADNDTVYRIPPSDALQGRLLAELVWSEGHQTVSTVVQTDPYGQGLGQAFSQRFQELGGSIQSSASVPASKTSDFGSIIDSLYASGTPPVLMLFAFAQPTTGLLREIVSSKGSLPTLYGVDANMIPDTLNNAPLQIAGMRGTSPSADTGSPEYQHFLNAYRQAVGNTPSANAENGYDAVYLIALAMARAGANNRAGVVTQLRPASGSGSGKTVVGPGEFAKAVAAIRNGEDVGYRGTTGAINFDANGDPSGANYQYLEIRQTGSGLGLVLLRNIPFNL